jgi:hypothetical protein
MWSTLLKDCNCIETTSNQGVVCNAVYNSDQFFYNGISAICMDLQNGDDITTAIQKLENFLCSLEVTQVFLTYLEDNLEQFPEFITLVNDALTCQTVTNCFNPTTTTTSSSTSTSTSTTTSSTSTTTTSTSTSSTTTTTTTAVPECKTYTLKSNLVNASWQGVRCSDGVTVGAILPIPATIIVTDCIYDNTLITSGMIVAPGEDCTTTTTTSSSSTTTTTSSSTTTTTTTLYPCIDKQLLVINNTDNTIDNVYADSWSTTVPEPPVSGPYNSISAIQNGTSNAINVDLIIVSIGCVSLYVNTVLIQSIPVYYSDTFTFDPVVIGVDDCVWIVLNTEC